MFRSRTLFTLSFVVILGVLSLLVYRKLRQPAEEGARRGGAAAAVAVEVAPVVRDDIELRRVFAGSLEAPAEFVVAPKVGGRIEQVHLDIGDGLNGKRPAAVLDDDEFEQAALQAEADLAVASATETEAVSALEIADRALERVKTLNDRAVASDAQLDAARADRLAKNARVAVARAQVTRAKAALEAARIRLGYTKVGVGSPDLDRGQWVVADRFVDPGDTVSANSPLLSIVQMDPLLAVVYITERDFTRLSVGQGATLTTDAYPGEEFGGTVSRIAPVFRAATRQARVELRVSNPGQRLKPGMFVRASVVLDRVEGATVIPYRALAHRDGKAGVFLVASDGATVVWREVREGIRDGDRVQVTATDGAPLEGRVVTLGQQLVEDGSRIRVPEPPGRSDGETAGPGAREDA